MIYYRRYVGDYLRDTATLSLLEHGAYTMLLDYYYAEEKPTPLDLDEVYRMVRAITRDERQAVIKVLAKFFRKQEDGYHNARADKEIATSRQARTNGKGGGRPRTGSQTGHETGDITGSETGGKTGSVTGRGGGSGHPPTTNLQPPSASLQKAVKGGKPPAPDGFEIVWQAYPKRAGNNPKGAAERAYRARIAAGIKPAEILDGVGRYARFCQATGKVGTEFVMRTSTFLGKDEPFAQTWAVGNGSAGEWWKTEAATLAKGKEVGIAARPGESMNEYRERVRAKLLGGPA